MPSPSTSDQSVASSRPAGSVPFTVEVQVKLQALVIPEVDGRYSVIVPALPGCVSQARSIEDVSPNLIEAAEGWLEVAHDQNKEEELRVSRGA